MKTHAWAAAGIGALLPALAVAPAMAGGGHDHGDDRGDRDGRHGDRDHRGDRGGHGKHGDLTTFRGTVTDLDTATDAPTDGVKAKAVVARGEKGSVAGIQLVGFDPADAGTEFGAHVHVGPCVEDDPDAAGDHYNQDVADGREPVRVDRTTEVWFDLTVDDEGEAADGTKVPFVVPEPKDGAQSIVLHEKPTDDSGDAGGRSACLPLK